MRQEKTELLTKNIKGREVPTLGFGTFELTGETCQRAVERALEVGYRHLDTARMYGNEREVGRGLSQSGLDRSSVFLTSKVWWEDLEPEAIRAEAEQSLEELGTDYLDLFLIHWPNPDVELAESIDALSKLVSDGLIRHYGVSNFPPSLFRHAVGLGDIFCNQVEYHPLLGQEKLAEMAREFGVALTAYSPLGQGEAIGHDELERIGAKHGKSSGQVALRWLIEQENVLAIPRSSKSEHIESNFAVFDFELDDEDREAIAKLPKDQRQIDPDFAPDWED